ncbi:hypothetical protein L6164_013177 [Bauhinia variegata]|uniref:Uncharacterized protein n=1 Tax=Bauhinia variegata TaxID=167791 RepID=A0ACB9PC86_BAUVA|nr:hypothetical protein L6164_013177 [Bauhinia variegata]
MKAYLVLSLALALAFAAVTYCDASSPFLPPVHVVMTNNLAGGMDVTIHCKSKNDDLGEHLVHSSQSWDFTFRPSYWNSTDLYCSFQWQGSVHWFDVYTEKRDFYTCTECKWSIREKQICRFNDKSGSYDDCYDYNSS